MDDLAPGIGPDISRDDEEFLMPMLTIKPRFITKISRPKSSLEQTRFWPRDFDSLGQQFSQ